MELGSLISIVMLRFQNGRGGIQGQACGRACARRHHAAEGGVALPVLPATLRLRRGGRRQKKKRQGRWLGRRRLRVPESADLHGRRRRWVGRAAGWGGGRAPPAGAPSPPPLPAGLLAAVLPALGFMSTGIAANSVAASLMSWSAVANAGGVPAGGLVATLQSLGEWAARPRAGTRGPGDSAWVLAVPVLQRGNGGSEGLSHVLGFSQLIRTRVRIRTSSYSSLLATKATCCTDAPARSQQASVSPSVPRGGQPQYDIL
uniref:Interferon alpha inducible protein 27 like 1 n=1 Tax=Canis lupus familiaris TaxID=9615 RepID=A0A8C0N039_CANLF